MIECRPRGKEISEPGGEGDNPSTRHFPIGRGVKGEGTARGRNAVEDRPLKGRLTLASAVARVIMDKIYREGSILGRRICLGGQRHI